MELVTFFFLQIMVKFTLFSWFHPPGPPVNVTCNIFINSFGSITETTMVRTKGLMRINACSLECLYSI